MRRRGEAGEDGGTFDGVGSLVLAEPLQVLVFDPGHVCGHASVGGREGWVRAVRLGRWVARLGKEYVIVGCELGGKGGGHTVGVVLVVFLLRPLHRCGIEIRFFLSFEDLARWCSVNDIEL